jgi:hypothetical protein
MSDLQQASVLLLARNIPAGGSGFSRKTRFTAQDA